MNGFLGGTDDNIGKMRDYTGPTAVFTALAFQSSVCGDDVMNIDEELSINQVYFGNIELLESRIAEVSHADQGSLRSALTYLYLQEGPVNLPRSRLKQSYPYLEDAEKIVIRWLFTRTTGSERKNYGRNALLAARDARYRCDSCGVSDVRALNLDHVHGRDSDIDEFACLCANCHTIKSRVNDWSTPD